MKQEEVELEDELWEDKDFLAIQIPADALTFDNIGYDQYFLI